MKFVHPNPPILLDRYDAMLATLTDTVECRDDGREGDPEHLRWMIAQLRVMPVKIGKNSRWMAWIQKGLCDLGLTTSRIERDFTRPLFQGEEEIPETLLIAPIGSNISSA